MKVIGVDTHLRAFFSPPRSPRFSGFGQTQGSLKRIWIGAVLSGAKERRIPRTHAQPHSSCLVWFGWVYTGLSLWVGQQGAAVFVLGGR